MEIMDNPIIWAKYLSVVRQRNATIAKQQRLY
jgi:hypothetical protein